VCCRRNEVAKEVKVFPMQIPRERKYLKLREVGAGKVRKWASRPLMPLPPGEEGNLVCSQ
jgi:hypothetical protein